MKSKRKWIALPEELHALIKKAADHNNRKIVEELKERFTRPRTGVPLKKERV